jgi:hypothetical protein
MLWAMGAFFFAYTGEFIGVAVATLVYLVWQLNLAARLPGRAGQFVRSLWHSTLWKVILTVVASTVMIAGTLLEVLTR